MLDSVFIRREPHVGVRRKEGLRRRSSSQRQSFSREALEANREERLKLQRMPHVKHAVASLQQGHHSQSVFGALYGRPTAVQRPQSASVARSGCMDGSALPDQPATSAAACGPAPRRQRRPQSASASRSRPATAKPSQAVESFLVRAPGSGDAAAEAAPRHQPQQTLPQDTALPPAGAAPTRVFDSNIGPIAACIDPEALPLVLQQREVVKKYQREMRLSATELAAMGIDPAHSVPSFHPQSPPNTFAYVQAFTGLVVRLGALKRKVLEVLVLIGRRETVFAEVEAHAAAQDGAGAKAAAFLNARSDASSGSIVRHIDEWRTRYAGLLVANGNGGSGSGGSHQPPRPFLYQQRSYEDVMRRQDAFASTLAASRPTPAPATPPPAPSASASSSPPLPAPSVSRASGSAAAAPASARTAKRPPPQVRNASAAAAVVDDEDNHAPITPSQLMMMVDEPAVCASPSAEPAASSEPVGLDEKQRCAATKIQSAFRMSIGAKRALYMRMRVAAATKVQSVVRMRAAARRARWVRRLHAFATAIQKVWRGCAVRKRRQRAVRAGNMARKIQSCFRGFLSRQRLRVHILEHRELKQAVALISETWHAHRERQRARRTEVERRAVGIIGEVWAWYAAHHRPCGSSHHHNGLDVAPVATAAAIHGHTRSRAVSLAEEESVPSDPVTPRTPKRRDSIGGRILLSPQNEGRRSFRLGTGLGALGSGGLGAAISTATFEMMLQQRGESEASAAGSPLLGGRRSSRVSFGLPMSPPQDPSVKVLYTAPFIDEVTKGDWLVLPPCPTEPLKRLPPLPQPAAALELQRTAQDMSFPVTGPRQRFGNGGDGGRTGAAAVVQAFARAKISDTIAAHVAAQGSDAYHPLRADAGAGAGADAPHIMTDHAWYSPRSRAAAAAAAAASAAAASELSPRTSAAGSAASVSPCDSDLSLSTASRRRMRLHDDLREAERAEEARQAFACTVAAFGFARLCADERRRRWACAVLRLQKAVALRRRRACRLLQRWWRAVARRGAAAARRADEQMAAEDSVRESAEDVAEYRRQKQAALAIEHLWIRQQQLRAKNEGVVSHILSSEERLCKVVKLQSWWKWTYANKINNPYREEEFRQRVRRELELRHMREDTQRESACVIQLAWRSFVHRRHCNDVAAMTQPAKLRAEKRLGAAVTIQRFYRFAATRQKFRAVLALKRQHFSELAAQDLITEKVMRIQALVRGHLCRKRYRETASVEDRRRNKAAAKVQKIVRGYLVWKWYRSFRGAKEQQMRTHLETLKKELLQGWPQDFAYPLSEEKRGDDGGGSADVGSSVRSVQ